MNTTRPALPAKSFVVAAIFNAPKDFADRLHATMIAAGASHNFQICEGIDWNIRTQTAIVIARGPLAREIANSLDQGGLRPNSGFDWLTLVSRATGITAQEASTIFTNLLADEPTARLATLGSIELAS